jgi:hypothetical protein
MLGEAAAREEIGMTSEHTGSANLDAIHDAIQATREEPLKDWAAVAIWEEDEASVIGEGAPLQMKGLLHSGLWTMAHSESGPNTAGALRQELAGAADVRDFPKGHMHVVRMGGASVGKATFEPGFKWSECVGPIVGSDTCPLEHMGVVLKGKLHIAMDDGEEFDLTAGDAIRIKPGHDAWTIGDETCEVLEVLSAAEYAKPAG